MYNSNNSGYPGYPSQQQSGEYNSGYGGYSGYPSQPRSDYGGSLSHASNLGFDNNTSYRSGAAPYPGGNMPFSGSNTGGRAPYPVGSTYPSGGIGFTPPSTYAGEPSIHPLQTMDTTYNYGGSQPSGQAPHGQQGSYGGARHPYQPHNSPFHGSQSAAFAMAAPRPTVYPNQNFNANASAEMLRKAMKGIGCDKQKVIQVLCTISNWQRQEVARAFKGMYGKDLISELKSELSGDFEDLIMGLMEPPAHYDARQLHDAMAGFGTKESVLIEIMTTRSNTQINTIKQTYQQLYHRQLEDDLIGDTSGHFKHLLVSLCTATRDESGRVDALKANQDAHALYRAGEQRMGTDESTFNMILASQNYAQLRAVFDEYQKVSGGHTIEQALNAEFTSDVLAALFAIVKCIRNRPAYFAELLHNSMKGVGTRDSDLIRLIVSRSEIDLGDIRDAYHRQYNHSLEKAIAGDCSGAYKDGLIALVKGN